jgi:hypothetical protein
VADFPFVAAMSAIDKICTDFTKRTPVVRLRIADFGANRIARPSGLIVTTSSTCLPSSVFSQVRSFDGEQERRVRIDIAEKGQGFICDAENTIPLGAVLRRRKQKTGSACVCRRDRLCT